MPFLESVQNLVADFNQSNVVNIEIMDQIVIHTELDENLFTVEAFQAFWHELGALTGNDIEESVFELQFRIFNRLLSRLPLEKISSFNFDVVEYLLDYIKQNEAMMVEVSYTLYYNLRYFLDFIIQRKNDISFLENLYKKIGQLLSANIDPDLEKEYQETLKSIVFRMLALPNGKNHVELMQARFFSELAKRGESSESQQYALLRTTLLPLIYLPKNKKLAFFLSTLNQLDTFFASSISERIIHTHTLILIESMDLFNEDRLVSQWKALWEARKIERNIEEEPQRLAIDAIDCALARLAPCLPHFPKNFRKKAYQELQEYLKIEFLLGKSHSTLSKALQNIRIDPMVNFFDRNAREQQVQQENNTLPEVWDALDNRLFLDPEFPQEEEITPLLDTLINSPFSENSVVIANTLIAHSTISASKFTAIWDRIMQALYTVYQTENHDVNDMKEQILAQILLTMSARFEGSAVQRQNNYVKIIYILDNLFQAPSSNPSFNINMSNAFTLMIKNLLQTAEVVLINDVWNQSLADLTRAPVYFLPLVAELFSLVGPHERASFWSQLQSFFAESIRNYHSGDTSIESMLQSFIGVLPTIMQKTPEMIKQNITDLNRTLNLLLMIPSPSASENEKISLLTNKEYEGLLFQVRRVQLNAMLCLIGSPDDLATLKQEVRNFFVHPVALNHPLCISAAMATESFNYHNLDGINTWLTSDIPFNNFSQSHDKYFFVASLFLAAKWSICHPEWAKLGERGVPGSTFFRKVINRIANLILHDNSFVQEVGLSVLKNFVEFYSVIQQMQSPLFVKKTFGVVKDLIELQLFGSQQCHYINENSIRGRTALYLGKQFFQKLERVLESFSSDPSVKKALLLIGIQAIPPTLKKNKSLLWAGTSDAASASADMDVSASAEKRSRVRTDDEAPEHDCSVQKR
jgi:hypothetical protein